MQEDRLSESKIYELALDCKKNAEDKREEINKYYPSLFTMIIAVGPFLNQMNQSGDKVIKYFLTQNVLVLLSLIGLIISVSWLLTLIRTVYYLQAVDKLLIEIEERNNQSLISYIKNHLKQHHSPKRITKHTMLGPYIFIGLFSISLIYYAWELVSVYI